MPRFAENTEREGERSLRGVTMNEQDIIYHRVNAEKEKVTVPAEKSDCPLMWCSLTVMADAIFVFLQLARFVGT